MGAIQEKCISWFLRICTQVGHSSVVPRKHEDWLMNMD